MVVSPIPLHAFPPNFEGNPLSYAYALFGLTFVSAICLANLLAFVGDANRYANARRKLASIPPANTPPWASLLGVWRGILIGFYLALFVTVTPDVLILSFWGEASDRTMTALFLIDRIGDGTALFPLVGATLLQAWAAQSMPQRLAEASKTPLPDMKLRMFTKHIKIAGLVLLISIGVTIGKASV